MLKNILFFSFLSTLFLVSCGPSEEDQKEKWQKNLSFTTSLSISYPSFKKWIKHEAALAKKDWKAIEQISEPEQRIKAMQRVNKFTQNGIIGNLKSLQRNYDNIVDKVDNLEQTTKTDYELLASQPVIREAKSSILRVKQKMKRVPRSYEEASAFISETNSLILKSLGSVNKIAQVIHKRKNAEREALRQAEKEANQAYRAAEAAKQKSKNKQKNYSNTSKKGNAISKPVESGWKCKYCGSRHAESVYTCNSCGANRK